MKTASIVLFALLLSGCASIPAIGGGQPAKLQQQIHQENRTTPLIIGADPATGKTIVANQTEQVYDYNYAKTAPKKSFIQRLWGWFLSLGLAGMAIMVFAPSSVIVWAVKKYYDLKKKFQLHRDALVETVKAIKSTNLPATHEPLKAALSNAQSPESQMLISQIRATI